MPFALSLLLTSLITLAAPAQEPTAERLPLTRKAFDALPFRASVAAIAIQRGHEPVILLRGVDAEGHRLTSTSKMPLGPLARVMIADAATLLGERTLKVRSGVTIGGTELSLLEILEGSLLVPSYWSLNPELPAVSSRELLACAEFAAAGGLEFPPDAWGMGDIELLRPRFQKSTAGGAWPEMLRVLFAAHVPALRLADYDSLPPVERARLPRCSQLVTRAQPESLRLLISADELAAWWQWRIQNKVILWEGPRRGERGHAPGRADIAAWTFFSPTPLTHGALVFPSHGAALVWLGDAKLSDRISRAFTTDLFGPDVRERTEEESSEGEISFEGGDFHALRRNDPWYGMRWSGTVAGAACTLIAASDTDREWEFRRGKESWRTEHCWSRSRVRKLYFDPPRKVAFAGDDEMGGLYLLPEPSAKDPQRLQAVWIHREDRMASVPRTFRMQLEPAAKK